MGDPAVILEVGRKHGCDGRHPVTVMDHKGTFRERLPLSVLR